MTQQELNHQISLAIRKKFAEDDKPNIWQNWQAVSNDIINDLKKLERLNERS